MIDRFLDETAWTNEEIIYNIQRSIYRARSLKTRRPAVIRVSQILQRAPGVYYRDCIIGNIAARYFLFSLSTPQDVIP